MLLTSERLYPQDFTSLEDFRVQLEEYLDYYNNSRIKSKRKGMILGYGALTKREMRDGLRAIHRILTREG